VDKVDNVLNSVFVVFGSSVSLICNNVTSWLLSSGARFLSESYKLKILRDPTWIKFSTLIVIK